VAALDPERSPEGRDYDLFNPINSFAEVVQRLVVD
jgi:hypothetical protein